MGCCYSSFCARTYPTSDPPSTGRRTCGSAVVQENGPITGRTERPLLTSAPSEKTWIAIKFPHGTAGIAYDPASETFVRTDIGDFIRKIYEYDTYDSWIVYNDEHPSDTHVKKGHCKGVLSWNQDKIMYLVHSVPKFPACFGSFALPATGLEYGQSFQCVEIPFDQQILDNIIQHISIMDANIYETRGYSPKLNNRYIRNVSLIRLSPYIVHIAKPPHCQIDIYSDYIALLYRCNWKVETWIRGHRIGKVFPNITDVTSIQYEDVTYVSTQDHSKFAVSDAGYFAIMDLNRMTSQFHRGGGGFITKMPAVADALRQIVKVA